MALLSDTEARVRERIPEASVEAADGIECGVLTVTSERIPEVLKLLRDEFDFNMLVDVSAVDWLPREPRYDVNYHLLSIASKQRLRVKARIAHADPPRMPTATEVYPSANWYEREIFDFFGVHFEGHPDLRRILMPDEWIGHPLRKDYPVGGVPVEYRIEPAYVGPNMVPDRGRPAAGGVPARLRRDRGRPSTWTWTGPPASGVAHQGLEDQDAASAAPSEEKRP